MTLTTEQDKVEVEDSDEAEEPALLTPNTIVAERYRIIEVLGQGGMGVVYKAEQILMNRIVALKMMLEKHTGTSLDYRRFRREAQSASQLDHPNIVSIHDFGFDEGRAYLCMDYLVGNTLEDMLPEAPLTLEQFSHIFVQVCDAIQHAHEKGIVHRDLKPSNIMLTEKGDDKLSVKILDFGLVKVAQSPAGEEHKLTATNMLVGTPLYMSPEQCQGEEVGPSSDIYSIACVMFESLTQIPPIFGSSMMEIMSGHVLRDPMAFAEANPELCLPPALEHIIMQALSKNPEDRPKSMKEFGKAVKLAINMGSSIGPHSVIAPSDIRAALVHDRDGADLHESKQSQSQSQKKAGKEAKTTAEAPAGEGELLKEAIDDDDELLMPLLELSLVGTTIDNNFKVLEMLGKGGMSVVYKARSQLLNKIVAIKTMHAHLVSDMNSLQRFRQEAQAASQLDHPNVIRVYSFGVTTGDKPQPYIVMDYIAGISLADAIKQQGHLPVPEAMKIFVQVCSALAHAHSKGVVHRDLKPSNIMLVEKDDDKQFVKIVDFGIAKILPQEEEGGPQAHRLTQTGDVFGSPTYMSPEQCMGKAVDKRSDVYAIGCVLYEALSGSPPHQGTSVFELFHKHTSEIPQSVKIPGAEQALIDRLDTIIFRALEKEPDKRYQTMSDLENDLHALQDDLVSGRKGGVIRHGIARHRRSLARLLQSHKKLVVLASASLLLLATGTVLWIKGTYILSQSRFDAPAYNWLEFTAPKPKLRNISEDEKREILDRGKTAMRITQSFNGTRAVAQLPVLKRMAEYCQELGTLEEEYIAWKKYVYIMNAAGSTDSIEYADACARLGYNEIATGNFTSAVTHLEKATSVRSKEDRDFPAVKPLISLAYASYKLGNYYPASESLRKAFVILDDTSSSLQPSVTSLEKRYSTVAHALSGDIYRSEAAEESNPEQKLEKLEDADKQYATAIKFYKESKAPKSKKPSRLFGQLSTQRGYLNLQLERYQEACQQFANARRYQDSWSTERTEESQKFFRAYAYASWKNNDYPGAYLLAEQAQALGNQSNTKKTKKTEAAEPSAEE